MGFVDILKGVIIAFVGGILIFLGLGMWLFSPLLEMYGFPNFGMLALPIAVVSIIFGLALLLYGQKLAGIR
jgi:hypothetical protein